MKFLTRFHHSWNLEIWFSSRKWRKMMKWDFWYQGGTRKKNSKVGIPNMKKYTLIYMYTPNFCHLSIFAKKNGYFENSFACFLGSFLMWIQIFMLVVTLGSPYWLGCPWQIYILNQCIPVGNRQIQFLLLKLKINTDQIISLCVQQVELIFDYDVIIKFNKFLTVTWLDNLSDVKFW